MSACEMRMCARSSSSIIFDVSLEHPRPCWQEDGSGLGPTFCHTSTLMTYAVIHCPLASFTPAALHSSPSRRSPPPSALPPSSPIVRAVAGFQDSCYAAIKNIIISKSINKNADSTKGVCMYICVLSCLRSHCLPICCPIIFVSFQSNVVMSQNDQKGKKNSFTFSFQNGHQCLFTKLTL